MRTEIVEEVMTAKRGLGLGSNNKKKSVSRYLACEPFDHSRDERETNETAKEFFFKNSETVQREIILAVLLLLL